MSCGEVQRRLPISVGRIDIRAVHEEKLNRFFAASRIRAADVILQGAFRGMELEDIEARVSELERAVERDQK